MEDNLKLRNEKSAFDINKCIICQNGKDLIQLRMEGVKSWKQLLSEKTWLQNVLKSLDMHKPFYYEQCVLQDVHHQENIGKVEGPLE